MAQAAIRKGAVCLKGNPVDLGGAAGLKVGDKAPVARSRDNGLQAVTVGGPGDKVRIFPASPSLDTPVCDPQTKRLNEEAAKLPTSRSTRSRPISRSGRSDGAAPRGRFRPGALSDHRARRSATRTGHDRSGCAAPHASPGRSSSPARRAS